MSQNDTFPDQSPSPTATSSSDAPASKWRFVRSRGGPVGGVCESLAVATGLDPTIVRVAMVGAAAWGPGLIAYLVVWATVPRADAAGGLDIAPAPESIARWLRIALIAAGALGMLTVFGFISGWRWPFGSFIHDGGVLGIALIAAGVGLILWRRRRDGESTLRATAAAAPTGVAAPGLPTTTWASDVRADVRADVEAPADIGTLEEPVEQVTTGEHGFAPPPPEVGGAFDGPPAAGHAGIDGESAGPPTDWALLIARIVAWLAILGALLSGAAFLAAVRFGVLDVRYPVLMWCVAAAAVLGCAAVAVRSRSSATIVAALLALLLGTGAIASGSSWNGTTGSRTVAPTSAQDLRSSYRVAAGSLVLNLSELRLGESPLATRVDVGVGRLDVVVPDGADVEAHSRVTAGESLLFGHRSDGWSVDHEARDTPAEAHGRIELDLEMGAGSVRVCRPLDANPNGRCRD